VADAIANDSPILHSPHLSPPIPMTRLFGFDRIYVISLRRRPRRLAKMRDMFVLLGIAFEWWEAVDGQQLGQVQLESMRFLPGYEDPFHRRPMKLGEIGCFLSHYTIWQEMIKNSLKKVSIYRYRLLSSC
jgi:collagen beta-1,O-galactosyltransferase